MSNPIRVAQIGNGVPPHSTENELRKALVACGHGVDFFQEGSRPEWLRLDECLARGPRPDLILWTRTASELNRIPVDMQERVVHKARDLGVPVVGYHLDIWWGLPRARELTTVPYFSLVDMMCTADGGHQDEWASIAVDHRWFPPAVSEFECTPARLPRHEFWSQVAFVGNWTAGYHPESPHRQQLVAHLSPRSDVMLYPESGKPALRGEDLRALYAEVPIIVGDSCNTDGRGRYLSDRVPETLGRGGFLIHPYTDGVTDGSFWDLPAGETTNGCETEWAFPMFTAGEHLACWHAGDWQELDNTIAHYLAKPGRRDAIVERGREHVLKHHTYTQRMGVLVDMLAMEGRLP